MHSKRNSSLPISLINIAIGVKNPKKIKLITMGLTIDPSKSPNLNHNLFNGKKISDFKTVIKKLQAQEFQKDKTKNYYCCNRRI